MKKYLWILACAMGLAACSESNTPGDDGGGTNPPSEQKVTCRITAPASGDLVDLSDPLTISGTGAVEGGSVAKVELRVGDRLIADVTSVPFDYTYAFPEGTVPGEIKIELTVTGDQQKKASSSVLVKTMRGVAPPEMGSMTDSRDGNVYRTVKLADQVWMADNLRYLPVQHTEVSKTEPRYYVIFDNDIKTDLGIGSLKAYGAFYNHPAAMQGEIALGKGEARRVKGVCPDGWHLPAREEWQKLARYVLDAGMAAVMSDGRVDETAIAKALASKTMWIMPPETEIEPQPTWVAEEMEKNDGTKFNGLPVGFRAVAPDDDGEYWMHACYSAGWWSSTAAVTMGDDFGVPVRMWSDLQTFVTEGSEFSKGVALPVRCLKD